MWSNFHTNTRDNIPELEQKCLLDRPDSFPAVRDPISKRGGVGERDYCLYLITQFIIGASLSMSDTATFTAGTPVGS